MLGSPSFNKFRLLTDKGRNAACGVKDETLVQMGSSYEGRVGSNKVVIITYN